MTERAVEWLDAPAAQTGDGLDIGPCKNCGCIHFRLFVGGVPHIVMDISTEVASIILDDLKAAVIELTATHPQPKGRQ